MVIRSEPSVESGTIIPKGLGIHVFINFGTKFEVNLTQIGHSIPKTPFCPILFTKKPTPPTFLMNLSETFRINVNMDFAHTNHGRF